MATKRLARNIIAKGTGLSGILEKGYNPDSYTIKELSTIFTRQRDITRKTLTRYENLLKKTNADNKDGFYTILLDVSTGEVKEKSDYMRTLKDLKKLGLSEDETKKEMIRQIIDMNRASEQFSLGSKEQQKEDSLYLKQFGEVTGSTKYSNTPNPVENRYNKKNARREVKEMFNIAMYRYNERGNDEPEDDNNEVNLLQIIADTVNQQYHHARSVFTLQDIKKSVPVLRALADGRPYK